RLGQLDDGVRLEVAEDPGEERRPLVVEDAAALVLVDDRLDPVGPLRLLGPRPQRLAPRVQVIAVPDVETELERGAAELQHAVELAVERLVPFDPEALPDQRRGMFVDGPQERDQWAVDDAVAGAQALDQAPDRGHARAGALDVDALAGGEVGAGRAEAVRRQ